MEERLSKLEREFWELRLENEKRIGEAQQKTTDAVRVIFTWGLPVFGLLSVGIMVASFIYKIL